ncbi:hypothetical protein [Roseateles sp. PN1]|uniref:hypothetical protein n=1 Tax=Roseateles sp. PN1 TaxID=3137372 RepID=UPI0031388E64
MNEHIRTDTFKVSKKDDEALSYVMEKSGNKNKSEAYRVALKTYVDLHQLPREVAELRSTIQTLNDSIQQLYFKLDVQGGQS